ncbi:MAG: CheR family methyltransferase [Erythrobacter sp.]
MSLRPVDKGAPIGAAALGAAIVPGVSPQVFGIRDFARIAELVHREAGIVLTDQKRMLAYSRLAPLVRKSGAATFGEYLDGAARDPAAQTQLIAALTTNHTYFYREPHHFEHFAQSVRPALIAEAEAGRSVRIWSAGCSSGEEIWTLMMVLMGADKAAARSIAGRDIVALASDLAGHALTTAEAATYPVSALAALPDDLVANWTEAASTPDQRRIVQSVRAMVRFRQLNLLHPWPFGGSFDVIFCRNVMIYFDGPTKEQLVAGFARHLRPGGFLYIGHSERVSGPASDLLTLVGPTIYQKVGAP